MKLRRLLAYKYIAAKNFSGAIGVYLEIKSRGGFDDICGELAECYAKNDQLESAVTTLNQGIAAKPENPQLYLELSAAYMSMGNVKGSMDTLQAFLDKFPDDKNYNAIADRLKSLKQEHADTAKPRAPSDPTRQERIYNWPDSFFPLKVYVAPNEDVLLSESASGISARSAYEIVQLACSEWQQATNGRLRFTFVLQPQDSNIEVAFTNDSSNMENQSAAGTTQWSGRGEAPKVRIYLLGSTDAKGPLEPERLLETSLHEFGHAVGLEHSNNVKDVMYYQMRPTPITEPSDVDARRVIVLYTR
jgi:tetratricopeptide (TPR) repeat protein